MKASFAQQYEKFQAESQQLARELSGTQETVLASREAQAKLADQVRTLRSQAGAKDELIETQDLELQRLGLSLAAMARANEALKQANRSLETRLAEIHKEHEDKIEALKLSTAEDVRWIRIRFEEQIQELRGQLADKDAELARQDAELTRKGAELTDFKRVAIETVGEYETRLDELRGRLDQYRAESGRAESRADAGRLASPKSSPLTSPRVRVALALNENSKKMSTEEAIESLVKRWLALNGKSS